MFIISDVLAKVLSKVFKGYLGILIHFMVLGRVCRYLVIGLWMLLTKLAERYGHILLTTAELQRMEFMEYPELAKEPKVIMLVILYVVIGILVLVLYVGGTIKSAKIYLKAQEEKYQTFGKARFAELKEVVGAGLQGAGIVFGKIKNNLITKPPSVEGHTLVIGGTGTGKSRGVVIPSLLKWDGAALVVDIKGELSGLTSERRARFGDVYIFNPEGDGECYNPIAQCRTVDAAQDLARTLIPSPEHGDPFWAQSAQAILAAFAFEGAVQGYLLTDIAERICTTPVAELVEHCRTSAIREVRLLASIAYDLPEKTLGGVMGELKSKLVTLATDPAIRRATRRADWSPATLETGATIYLKVSEHLLTQYKELWTVIISQVLKHLSQREERKQPPILIALDEMPRLSKIAGLTSALATLRSRNVHILGVMQSMAQLDSIYGRDERKVIADNCRFKFVLSATDPETQKYFSDLVGQKTVMASALGGHGVIPMRNYSEQGAPLIRPEEWANLRSPILLAPGLQPVEVSLAYWDKEKFFR